jgi:hypothetical protein
MSDKRVSLTFVLALSAASVVGAGALVLGARTDLLKPGNLRNLLVHDQPAAQKPQDRVGEVAPAEGVRIERGLGHVAQGCFSGFWRRC